MLQLIIDISDLETELGVMSEELESRVTEAVTSLANQTHGHILEEVQNKLKSSKQAFLESLRFENPEPHLFVITVPKKMLWLEDGTPEFSMLEGFLKSPKAKVNKKGEKYLVIPFSHSKGPSKQTPFQTTLTDTIKAELKNRGIPFRGIERNNNGSPKTGLVHKIKNIESMSQSNAGRLDHYWNKKGGSAGIKSRLEGINVYQTPLTNKDGTPKLDKGGNQKVSRDILTFRTASQSQEGSGKWTHPAVEGRKFLDEALTWAENLWETKIKPELINSIQDL